MVKALIVDDISDNAFVISEMLASAGYRCVTCNGGEEAEQMLLRERFDVLITDMIMPLGNGFDLIRFARLMHFPGKIIAMSGGGPTMQAEVALEAAGFHADVMIQKPFEKEILIKALQNLFGESPICATG